MHGSDKLSHAFGARTLDRSQLLVSDTSHTKFGGSQTYRVGLMVKEQSYVHVD